MPKRVPFDLTGQQFGDWTVLSKDPRTNSGHSRWLCRCSCGVERTVLGNNLKRGKTVSCGHQSRTADGLSEEYTSEYDTWRQMIDRCENPGNPAFHRYGDRGIWVCDRWRKSFKNFLDDVSPRPISTYQLDRIDNDGPYSADNCRWVSAKTNSHNSTSVRLIEFDGERLPVVEWERKLGFKQGIISGRLHNGWSVKRALTQTPRKSPVTKNPRNGIAPDRSAKSNRADTINPPPRRRK